MAIAPNALSQQETSLAQPRVVEPRKWGQWALGAIAAVLIGLGVASLAMNPRLQTGVIGHYLFSGPVISGVKVTLELTALTLVLGVALGLVLALMRHSENRVLSALASIYIAVFRAVPPLLQLIFWAFLAALYPKVGLGIPGTGAQLFAVDSNSLIRPFTAAIIGLTLIEAAYAAEAIRGGLMSVDPGQVQAAKALGLRPGQIMRKITIPQAVPATVPPMGNNAIILLKSTSLVSVIGTADLMTSVQRIYADNYEVIPLLTVAGIWYVLLVGLMTYGQHRIERRYGRHRNRDSRRNKNAVG